MNAIEDNRFSRRWEALGAELPSPRAILSVSAHWETDGVAVTAMPQPRTIYDFYGFPKALHEVSYPAPGDPELAARVCDLLAPVPVRLDQDWGLDHGIWSVLCRMYPSADIPVVQLSLDRRLPFAGHFSLARALQPLREEGVLVFASGNIVHNLREIRWNDEAYDWAVEFDALAADAISAGDDARVIAPQRLGGADARAIPTPEHYLPLLYALAVRGDGEQAEFFNAEVTLGSMSMRGVRFG
jgi:4,5-DOPA dioxygenase extradiol